MIALAIAISTAVAIPRPELTPGAIDPAATVAKLCTPGYTASIRHVTAATKREVFKRYGIPQDGAAFEVDHWISLEIGGLNDITNLWPQPWPNARNKDVVETYLHHQICSGKMTIQEAIAEISNWPRRYAAIKARR